MQFSALFTGLAFATSAVAMLPVEIISPAELSVVEVDSVQPVAWTGDNEALGNVTVISLSGGKTSTSMDPCGIIVEDITNENTMIWNVMETTPEGDPWTCKAWENRGDMLFGINIKFKNDDSDKGHWSDSFKIPAPA